MPNTGDLMFQASEISAAIQAQQQSMGNAGGLGAYGFNTPQQYFPAIPGIPGQSPGFNYNAGYDMGYGPGAHVGGMGVGAIAGAGMLGMATLSGLSMFNKAGPLEYAVNPFKLGGMAYNAAGNMGMGMGGRLFAGALGAAPAMLGLGLASHAIGSMVHGSQQQANMDRIMGQFNFMNPASRTGRGFSRQDSMSVGNMVREIAHLPEMLTSVSELSRIMDKVSQMGLMNGVKDVTTFKQKFKDTVETLKNVSKVMGTTMEDALSFFGEARSSGFYSSSDILKNAVSRNVVSANTGMNQGQVGQLQQTGAGMSFAMGGTRRYGAAHALRTANQIGIANQMGVISNEKILEMTGLEGSAGQQALANMFMDASYKMIQSPMGRALALGLGKMENGRYTGEIDQDLVDEVRMGTRGIGATMSMGRRKAGTRKGKLSFWANRNKLAANAAGSLGVEGTFMMAENILGKIGYDNPDAKTILMERMGVDSRLAEMIAEQAHNLPNVMSEAIGGAKSAVDQKVQESWYREHASWDAIKKRISQRISNVLTHPIEESGARLRNYLQGVYERASDSIFGIYRGDVTPYMSGQMANAAGGVKSSADFVSSVSRYANKATEGIGDTGYTRLSRPAGFIGGTLSGLADIHTMGGFLSDMARAGGVSERTYTRRRGGMMAARGGGGTETTTDTGNFNTDELSALARRLEKGDFSSLSEHGSLFKGSGVAGAVEARMATDEARKYLQSNVLKPVRSQLEDLQKLTGRDTPDLFRLLNEGGLTKMLDGRELAAHFKGYTGKGSITDKARFLIDRLGGLESKFDSVSEMDVVKRTIRTGDFRNVMFGIKGEKGETSTQGILTSEGKYNTDLAMDIRRALKGDGVSSNLKTLLGADGKSDKDILTKENRATLESLMKAATSAESSGKGADLTQLPGYTDAQAYMTATKKMEDTAQSLTEALHPAGVAGSIFENEDKSSRAAAIKIGAARGDKNISGLFDTLDSSIARMGRSDVEHGTGEAIASIWEASKGKGASAKRAREALGAISSNSDYVKAQIYHQRSIDQRLKKKGGLTHKNLVEDATTDKDFRKYLTDKFFEVDEDTGKLEFNGDTKGYRAALSGERGQKLAAPAGGQMISDAETSANLKMFGEHVNKLGSLVQNMFNVEKKP